VLARGAGLVVAAVVAPLLDLPGGAGTAAARAATDNAARAASAYDAM
jgi:hypothetical protein